MYTERMTSISVSQARATLPDLVDRVLAGEEITITRHGQPVAVVLRPDAVRARRADDALAEAERLRDLIDRSRATPLAAAPTLTTERADELVAEVHRSRSRS